MARCLRPSPQVLGRRGGKPSQLEPAKRTERMHFRLQMAAPAGISVAVMDISYSSSVSHRLLVTGKDIGVSI